MSFVPVEFGLTNRTIVQSHGCDTLHLPPLTGSVLPFEPLSIPYRSSGCDCLDVMNVTENVKLH